MSGLPCHLPPRQALLLILLPLLATFAGQGLNLQLIGAYHLFIGLALVMPASFILAFGPRSRRTALLSRVALGIGSAMILDEVVYLIATKASEANYISPLSMKGAIVFVTLGVLLLLVFHGLQPGGQRRNQHEKP